MALRLWAGLIALSMTFSALICSPAVGQGQPECGPYEDVLRQLEADYQEVPVATGWDSRGHIVEILASPGGGTWTIIIHDHTGTACIAAAGENWRSQEPVKPGQGA